MNPFRYLSRARILPHDRSPLEFRCYPISNQDENPDPEKGHIMSVIILSDLHLDIWAEVGKDPFGGLDPNLLGKIEHCILAGDITNKAAKKWEATIGALRLKMPNAEIYAFPGNHEFYGGHIDREDKLEAAARAAGARYAQKGTFILSGKRFLCATLWTDFRLNGATSEFAAKYDAERMMNDYRKIRVEHEHYRRLSPDHAAAIHHDHVSWITAELEKDFPGERIVVTHHAPHKSMCVKPGAHEAPAYASDLTQLISRFQPAAWFCGHTHSHDIRMLGDTLMMNASLGYPFEFADPEDHRARMEILLTGVDNILAQVRGISADGGPGNPAL